MSVNITNPIYRAVPGLIRFWGGRIRALIWMFRGIGEVSRKVIEVAVEPRQRAHRVRLTLRRIAGRICSVKHTRFDQRSRRAGDRRTQRSRDIGIAVVARDAIGAIDNFAALDRAQLAWLAAGRHDHRDRRAKQCGASEAERPRHREADEARDSEGESTSNPRAEGARARNAEGARNRIAAVTASAQAPQTR
jgi:hypothetical protein